MTAPSPEDQLFDKVRRFLVADAARAGQVGGPVALAREVHVRAPTWEPWLSGGGHSDRGANFALPAKAQVIATESLRDLPPVGSGNNRRVDRARLLDLSAAAKETGTTQALIKLWVTTMMWGSGTSNGRGPWRTAQGLADARLESTLQTSAEFVWDQKLGEAYSSFRLAGCGVAFFTKWLWAASLSSDGRPKPLILDQRVRSTIAAACAGQPQWKLRGRNGFVSYCVGLENIANRLAKAPYLAGVNAEKVEWLLFERDRESHCLHACLSAEKLNPPSERSS